MILPPPLDDASRERLLRIYGRLDRMTEDVVREYGDQLVCREGCSQCCRHRLALRGAEAAYLLEGARALGADAVSLVWQSLAGKQDSCPLLQGGICLAYQHRPAICRTQGLAILRREGGHALLHHCPLNFQGMDVAEIPATHLVDEVRLVLVMDGVDSQYSLSTEYRGGRVTVGDLLRAGLQP